MNEPAVDHLVEKVESKYSLVIAVARRAREIVDNSPPMIDSTSQKSVSIALEEIYTGKVEYENE